MTKLETFKLKGKTVHGDKYDYSKVDYKANNIKVTITCPIHGDFNQTPIGHVCNNQGCPKCGRESRRLTLNEFLLKADNVHDSKYDYSKVDYKTNNIKVTITCPTHGDFDQHPYSHLNGRGCPDCGIISRSGKLRKSLEGFILEATNIHGIYDYSKVTYHSTHKKVCIICPTHGEFHQTPASHLLGVGCPICSSSKGENAIHRYLTDANIIFHRQKVYDGCKNVLCLPFDFYIPSLNTCIEYDGVQHFESVKYFGGLQTFKRQKMLDKIKTEYCLENNIQLLRIPYYEYDNINNILATLIHTH